MTNSTDRRVAIVAGCRTPFCKAGTDLKYVRAVDLARHAARELLERTNLNPHAINEVITRRRLTQAAAADRLRINQPKVSALANYKLSGFSVERLMSFLTALDQDVEIVIKHKPRSRPAGRISVIAA